jgi:hypothetical protein
VGTTLQKKFQQDAKRRILHKYNFSQHQTNTRLPIFPYKTDFSTQQHQLQTIKINVTVLTEPNTIRTEVRNFFKSFYTANGNQTDIKDDAFTNIPSLDKTEREKCDAPLTLTELTTALHKSNSGRSPGLDGITYEFYKKFWNELGPLLLRVANTSMQEEKLPPSMLNGVITLVPKKGDLTTLSNWRPITLQNTDYKLITRCLANRITPVLPALITTDQSY